MTDYAILGDLGAIVLAAAGMALLARRVRVPPIIAYIAAGLLLGPATGWLDVSGSVGLISEAGIALLLFLVGLELSLDRVRDVGRVALGAGSLQIVLTTAAGFAFVSLLGFRASEAWILALAVTFSSTVVVVRILQAGGIVQRTDGRIAVGILLVQDVAVAIALTVVAAAGSAGVGDGAAAGGGTVLPDLVRAGIGLVALLAFSFVSVRWLLPPVLRWLGASLEIAFVSAMAWCFLYIAAAHRLGLSVEIGAFIGGVTLAQCAIHGDLVRRVHPLVSLFIAVFFVALGIHVDAASVAAGWRTALLVAALVVAGKPLIVAGLVLAFGYGARTAFRAGIALGQMSEFAFILGGLAVATGLLQPATFSIIVAAGIGTIAISAALMPATDRVWVRLERSRLIARLRQDPAEPDPATHALRGHVIVVGMNALGRRLVHQFVARGETVLAIDADPVKLDGLPGHHLAASTDYASVLDSARLADAKLLVSALQIEAANNLLAYRARCLGVPASIHAFDAAVITELKSIGADYLMVSKHDGIRQIADELRRAGVID